MAHPAKSPRLALEQMLAAIADLERFIAGMTDERFLADRKTQAAVERCIEIISEASRRLPDAMKARHPEVPWRKVAGVGNILRHEYDQVRPAAIWSVATIEIAPLKAAVGELLAAVLKDWPAR